MLQGGEIIIILLLALIVLGPKRLPEIARQLGKWTAELRAAAREISQGLEKEVAQIKEPLDELTGPVKEIKKELSAPIKEIKGEFRDVDPRKHEWKGPKPLSGPTPEDAMADLEKIEKAEADNEEGNEEASE